MTRNNILQSAFSSICFGYSWGEDKALENCLKTYGLAGESFSRADCSEEEFIGLAVKNIMGGYPVILVPREYSDMILATGFSHQGKVLKGLPFLDGDDDKNAVMSFQQLKSFPEWYAKEFHMLLIKPYGELVPTAEKCREALRKGAMLLGNQVSISDQPLVGLINTPGGSVEYGIPVMKSQRYTIEDIFGKNLLFLIPFHIFSHGTVGK